MSHLIVEYLASFLIWFLFIGLGVLWVIDGKIKKEQVIHALFACAMALLTAFLIKLVFPTDRPFILNGGGVGVFMKPHDGAFPSEHSALAFALAVTVFLHDRKVGWVFLLSAILIGAARVWANVHYPIDIVGGAFIGTITAVIVERTHFSKLFSRRKTHRH